MIRLFIYVIVGFCVVFESINLQAQTIDRTLAATAGDYFSNGAGSISFSIGEPISETFYTSESTLLQGFQQPELKVTPVGIETVKQILPITVYPNPVQNDLTVEIPEMEGATVQLFDITGKILITIESSLVSNGNVIVDMSAFPAGTYMLLVHNKSGERWQYKVQKFGNR